MNKNLKTFEPLFKELFKPLCGFAIKYVSDRDEAKNIVHEIFIAVWEKMDSLPADIHYRSYLFTAVRNRCLNYLRDKKNHLSIEDVTVQNSALDSNSIEASELEREIELAINTLPEKCRQVFEYSRSEGLKYSEIAEKMSVSVKTVEAQMSKALKIMRGHLTEFLSTIFILFHL